VFPQPEFVVGFGKVLSDGAQDLMKIPAFIPLILMLLNGLPRSCQGWDDEALEYQWPQFRGPLATGVAPHADPPVKWSEDSNVLWKVKLPGLGHSSPAVWEDRIFLTTSVPTGKPLAKPRYSGRPGAHDNLPITQREQFVALCVDRNNGKILWTRVLAEAIPNEGGHETNSLASASPVVDEKYVFAFFGSYGLFCLDREGKVVWQRDLGDQITKHGHGEGASPVLYRDTLVVNWDHEGDSFVVAFDRDSGREKWRTPRDEKTSWATPIVVENEGRIQVVISGSHAVRGYDLATGEVIWECRGLSANVVASPVSEPGFVYAASSYDFQAMLGIRLAGAKGDITDNRENVIWKRNRRTPYVPSPLLYDGVLYFLAHYQGVLSRVVGKTGEEPTGPFRLPGLHELYASPVAAAGRIYLLDRSGLMIVLSQRETPEFISANQLDDRFSATPALVGNDLFLRGERFLYCLRNEKE